MWQSAGAPGESRKQTRQFWQLWPCFGMLSVRYRARTGEQPAFIAMIKAQTFNKAENEIRLRDKVTFLLSDYCGYIRKEAQHCPFPVVRAISFLAVVVLFPYAN